MKQINHIIIIMIGFSLIMTGCVSIPVNTFYRPTATVIDAETGEPIEGAVGLALWWELASGFPSFEGGPPDRIKKAKEAVTDKDGKLYIPGFWNWYPFGGVPTLTVYKPGYICWNQEYRKVSNIKTERRNDFYVTNRVVKMEKWRDDLSYVGHDDFVNFVTKNGSLNTEKRLFRKLFEEYEYEKRQKEKESLYYK